MDQALHDPGRDALVAGLRQCRQRVDHNAAGAVPGGDLADLQQMELGAAADGASRFDAQQPRLVKGRQIDADRGEVADNLVRRRVEADEQRGVAPGAGRLREGPGQGRLGGTRRPGQQHAGTTVIAAAQHRIEPLHATGKPLHRRADRRGLDRLDDGDHDPLSPDAHGCRVLLEQGAAILADADAALGGAVDDLMFENDGTIHHELEKFQGIRHRAAASWARLRGDDGGQPLCGQPFVQAVGLLLRGLAPIEQRQHHVERVEDDASGPHGLGLGPKSRQQAAEIEPSRLDQPGARLRVQKEQLLVLQRRQIPTEARGIGSDAPGAFLERHEDAGLAQVPGPIDQRLQGKNRLAGTRPTLDQRQAATRQPTQRHGIQPGNAGRCLADRFRLYGLLRHQIRPLEYNRLAGQGSDPCELPVPSAAPNHNLT